MKVKLIGAAVLLLILAGIGWWLFGGEHRGQVGTVSTNFRWLGPSDSIAVDGFDDPKIEGVACHISRPQRGGVSGALGTAERPRKSRSPAGRSGRSSSSSRSRTARRCSTSGVR